MSGIDGVSHKKRSARPESRELAKTLTSRGVLLRVDNGVLNFEAAKGLIGPEELIYIAENSDELILALQDCSENGGISGRRLRSQEISAPLAYSQLAHWNTYALNRRPSACIIPSAIRLRGLVDVGALKASVIDLARRHGALRTRILAIDGSPTQLVVEGDAGTLLEDIAVSIPSDAPDDCIAGIAAHTIPNYVDVQREPLFGFRLIRMGPRHCALVLYMEHIVSDGASAGIALRDVLCLYRRRMGIGCGFLKGDPLQFYEYARRQRDTQQVLSGKSETEFQQHMAGSKRVPFPSRSVRRRDLGPGWGVVSFAIEHQLVDSVRRWARRARTTSVMAFFACYAAFAMRWCEVSELTTLFQVTGRDFCGAEDSVGYYAFPMYLRLELGAGDSLFDLMTQVMEELCFAHDHADFSLAESKVPRPEYTRNTCFNWLRKLELPQTPWTSGGADPVVTELGIETGNLCRIRRDTEPMMGIVEAHNEITGGVYFSRERFDDTEMQECARWYLALTSSLIENPGVPIARIRIQ